MSVYNEHGTEIELFSLWKDRKVIIAFTRHMGCRFCKEQVQLLEQCQSTVLNNGDISSIIVTIGRFQDIPKFRKETEFTGEIYVDTDLHHPKCYRLLKFENGEKVLFQESTKNDKNEVKSLLPSTLAASQRGTVVLTDGGYGSDDSPYTGDTLQIGGVFVLGPGNICDFSFRSAFVGDIPDMTEVCAAATGVDPKTGVEVVYPSTIGWNQRLRNDKKLFNNPVESSAMSEVETISHMNQVSWPSQLFVTIPMSIGFLVFAPNDLTSPSLMVFLMSMTALLLLLFHYRHMPLTILSDLLAFPKSSVSQTVDLITLRELDRRILASGCQKCECSFIKDIDMTVLRPHSIDLENDEAADQNSAHVDKDIVPLESTQCYVREFLAKPNPLLGRKGPTCPFVPASIKMDSIHLGVVKQDQVRDVDSMKRVVLNMVNVFKDMEPNSGPQAQYKAIILIFPFISLKDAPSMIDGVQKQLKPIFVEEGLMLGEFHKLNNASGLHNSNFFPLRTPYPCLAIRTMVPSDIVFLNGHDFPVDTRRAMIKRYLSKFGDAKNSDSQTEVARKLLDELSSC